MNELIKQVLTLQTQDVELDHLQAEAAAIPAKIAAIKKDIQDRKGALEGAKKDLMHFQSAKKARELDLEAQEASIRKHSGDLNNVKTNEAYRALVGEIDKAKAERSKFEDAILQLMDQIDQANKIWKEKEAVSKSDENGLLKQISELEEKQKSLEQQAADKKTQRDQLFAVLAKPLAETYQRIRGNRKGAAAVPIRSEQCTGCHMKVAQSLINEVRRGQKILTCESCSRILYLEDPVTAA